MKLFDTFLSIIYPRQCVSCGKFGKYFCSACVLTIQPVNQTICPVCTRPSVFGQTHPHCTTKYSLDGLTSVYRYTGPIRQSIKLLKYKRVTDIVPELTTLVIENLKQPGFTQFLKNKLVIIPIPLHWLRKKKRWFNQSEVIAGTLAQELKVDMQTDVLLRKKSTHPQAELTKADRLHNIKGTFGIRSDLQIPQSVILFDDVWTTGSTMREAGNVLKRAGVKRVWALTIAR